LEIAGLRVTTKTAHENDLVHTSHTIHSFSVPQPPRDGIVSYRMWPTCYGTLCHSSQDRIPGSSKNLSERGER
jgi:hypothetical protein